MLNLLNRSIIVILLLTLASCVYLPATSNEQSNCNLYTKKLLLKGSNVGVGVHCSGDECLSILIAASAVSLSTLIVSGSIVLIGNTFHWLEKEGLCNDGFIKLKINEFYQFLGVD